MKYKNTSFPASFSLLDHDSNLETKFFLLRKKGYSVLSLVKRKPPRGGGFKNVRCAQSQGLVGMVESQQWSHRLTSQGLLPRSRRRGQILKDTAPEGTGQIGHAPHYAMLRYYKGRCDLKGLYEKGAGETPARSGAGSDLNQTDHTSKKRVMEYEGSVRGLPRKIP